MCKTYEHKAKRGKCGFIIHFYLHHNDKFAIILSGGHGRASAQKCFQCACCCLFHTRSSQPKEASQKGGCFCCFCYCLHKAVFNLQERDENEPTEPTRPDTDGFLSDVERWWCVQRDTERYTERENGV